MAVVGAVLIAVAGAVAIGAAQPLTSHPVQKATLGTTKSSAELLALIDVPGTLELTTVSSADWGVDRGGLINLKNPKAVSAGLGDEVEPIHIYFHAIRHPTKGLYIVDTGVERAMRDAPEQAALSGGIVSAAMHLERMKFVMPLGDWLSAQSQPLNGVLMTHLHGDHVSGMRDVPHGTPIFSGPGEAKERGLMNVLVGPLMNKAFEGQAPLSEWQFAADASGRFDGVIDVFGDGQLWAIWVPGHTTGSTAYLARTAHGPVLLTGDTCHTAWGWEHDVEPGSFTADQGLNAKQLHRLRQLVEEHPAISVRLGHQALVAKTAEAGAFE